MTRRQKRLVVFQILSIQVFHPRSQPRRIAGKRKGYAELIDHYWRNLLNDNETEPIVPNTTKVIGESRIREVGLIVQVIRIFRCRIDYMTGDIQFNRVLCHPSKVISILYTLYEYKKVRVGR